MVSDSNYISQNIPNVGGLSQRDIVLGKTKFTADIYLPDALHVKILRSPYAHAKIISIDTSEAESLPGVVDIITKDNTPEVLHCDELYQTIYQDYCRDGFVFNDTVRWAGEDVAAVLAESSEIAEEAIEKIKVTYEELPIVTDAVEASKANKSILHQELNDIGPRKSAHQGDPDNGFNNADLEFSCTIDCPNEQHFHPENYIFMFKWGEDGCLNMYISSQSTYWPSYKVWHRLGVTARTICHRIGCGFGNKCARGGMKGMYIGAMLAMRNMNRPIRLEYSLRECGAGGSSKQSRYITDIEYALNNDGQILAERNSLIQDQGAYQLYPDMLMPINGNYTIAYTPNYHGDAVSVYTNDAPGTMMRGIGGHHSCNARETSMDMAAEELGMNPVDFRLKNKEQLPYTNENSFEQVINTGASEFGWGSRWKGWNQPSSVNGSKVRGVGVALGQQSGAFGTAAAAVTISFNGTVNILANSMDMGQGVWDAERIAVAETLGADLNKVFRHAPSDSFAAPTSSETTASRGACLNVNAVTEAAIDARNKLYAFAAQQIGAKVEKITSAKGYIYSLDDPSKKYSFEEIMLKKSYFSITGEGIWDQKAPPKVNANALFVEVEVDVDTGDLKVIEAVTVHDVGKAISRDNVEKQMEAGVIFGQAYGTAEILKDKNTGVHLNDDYLGYRIPLSLEIPKIKTIILENFSETGHWGANGIGEPVCCSMAAALGNAVRNAIGARITEYPITPEKILKALGKA
ncbi:MAG: xanthine dehydrogenase family protein molybdopterin-binding subunit [Dehalococcoidales bacterium]